MRKACLVMVTLCFLLISFPNRSSSIARTKHPSVDAPLAMRFDKYGFISLAKEKRRLDRFARELQRKLAATSQVLVYGRNQADVDARMHRIRNYLVKKRGINPYRVLLEAQACRREFKTELWIVPPGATAPALAEGPKLSPCKMKTLKSAHGVTGVMNARRA
jgi:hypothetical protein